MSQAVSQSKHLLIVGCGYVGLQVAQRLREAGGQVTALTRSQTRFAELKAAGVEPFLGNWHDPTSLRGLPAVDRILVSVPHRADDAAESTGSQASGAGVDTHARGLAHLLSALPTGWSKLVYLSTTGVYGGNSQDLVNEQTAVAPTRPGPALAVAAEQWLSEHTTPAQCTMLRLAGIYGPGRVPLADRVRAGLPLKVPRDGYLNLVHVADIARMIHIALDRTLEQSLYVFSDGQPVLRETFYRDLAQLCGVAEPKFAPPDPSDAKVRRATDKRIDPSRLVNETGFVYQFPNYICGLSSALSATHTH